MQAKVLSVLISSFLVIGHLFYSISYPDGRYSFFQSNLYGFCAGMPLISTPLKRLCVKIVNSCGYLLPINEFISAHDIIIEFVDPAEFYEKSKHLLFVTFHIQIGIGFLGIGFLRAEQVRKNSLVKIEEEVKKNKKLRAEETNVSTDKATCTADNGRINEKQSEANDASTTFRRSAAPFIFFAALPYMMQLIFYGGMNQYAFHCFRDDIHRTVRLNDLFANDGNRFVATATNKQSNLTPDSYATNSETIVKTVYDTVNRNIFSLPKLMLLPGIVAKQPMLVLKITPLILLSDWIKSQIVAAITTEVERVNEEVKNLQSMRTKVEQYDLKNAELIQRSGHDSVLFTERKWISFTEDIQDKKARTSLMARSKMYFAWLQRNFVMLALVDCALAKLIAVGKIFAADIFVYARAIEDMINFVLMRSRQESELASMKSSIKILRDLKDIWDKSEERNLLDCTISNNNALTIDSLAYTRGSASVKITNISLLPGIYAVTGANGSGKSTLFRLLMGCTSNSQSVDLDSSVMINSPGLVQMPSSDVVEISQNFYFPLFSAPFDWIFNIDIFEGVADASNKEKMVIQLEKELRSLKFYPETQLDLSESTLMDDLTSVEDDWFSVLSGGQKSKVELVRKVFLADQCPRVLLIDEAFAPLDPESKSLVMQKLKSFCSNSIVLVIYHADTRNSAVAEGEQENDDSNCVESSNFFDNNVHVEDGTLFLRPVCLDN
eukprot:CAMPEP_0194332058 /NCGR_PEP_ID=MMETSP0171-20130528/57857_1 /TAXON_ID=218684 /ORGANISM="Corethron pennatum, Strain L29A3" /LENGTH=721 /DNA_ID=CAMNT_0039093759 /DNA_START=421 /DNA_END=2586 /DNA_ORIENTATION=-